MRSRAAAAAGALLLLAGCVYYNALYNAERLFQEGERYRRAGQDSLAAERYEAVIEKAAGGFRREPDGEWADDALLLIGCAHLRRGELRQAVPALEEAARRAEGEQVRLQAVLHLGEARFTAGDVGGATLLLNQAMAGLAEGPIRAEGHLWRGRALLEAGEVAAGWRDLDRAASERRVRLEAALDRVGWGVRLGSFERAREGMSRLLSSAEAGPRADTVAALARSAGLRWGPAAAAELLAGSDSARWEPSARGRIRLARASLLSEAGDTTSADRLVRSVARGFGPAAAEARLQLAARQLARAEDLVEARAALALLLPAVGDPEVTRLVASLREMTELAERGFEEPLAWFAAGEVARDRLRSPALARGLLLAYADAAPSEPWATKALLAALEVTRDEGDRAWLLGRLESRADSPYVLAARGEPALGLEALEEELALRLERLRTR